VNDNFPIVIFWSEEDDAFVADLPDLHACTAWGGTADEALRELLVARKAWLAVAHEAGIHLPDPRNSPYLPETARQREPVAAGA